MWLSAGSRRNSSKILCDFEESGFAGELVVAGGPGDETHHGVAKRQPATHESRIAKHRQKPGRDGHNLRDYFKQQSVPARYDSCDHDDKDSHGRPTETASQTPG